VLAYGKHKKTYKRGTKVRVKRDPSELTLADAPEFRIVPEELWTAVQEQIASSAHKPWVAAPGPKSKHLLAGLAFCGVCGGRMKVHKAKFGADNVKMYVCKRQQELAACSNKLKRPLKEIDAEIIEEIQKRVLTDSFVAEVLREARGRLTERMKAAETDEAPQLRAEASKVKGELANLSEAVASGGAAIPALVAKMTERQARLTAIEGRLTALHAAPKALQLETKRLEKEISVALGELREVFSERPQDARRFLERLLDGSLTFTPVETWKGRRYRIEGQASLGGLVRLPQTLIVASPEGVEPLGAPERFALVA